MATSWGVENMNPDSWLELVPSPTGTFLAITGIRVVNKTAYPQAVRMCVALGGILPPAPPTTTAVGPETLQIPPGDLGLGEAVGVGDGTAVTFQTSKSVESDLVVKYMVDTSVTTCVVSSTDGSSVTLSEAPPVGANVYALYRWRLPTTNYTYHVSSYDEYGRETFPSPGVTITNSSKLGENGNYNVIQWTPVDGAASYRCYRVHPDDHLRRSPLLMAGDELRVVDNEDMEECFSMSLLNETVIKGAEILSTVIPPTSYLSNEAHEKFFLEPGERLLIWGSDPMVGAIAFGIER